MKKVLVAVLFLALLLCGCHRVDPEAPTKPRLVVQVNAQYESDTLRLQRLYTDDEKIRAVLDYFRGLDPYGAVAESDLTGNADAWIELLFSDGTSKRYQQRGTQFLRCGNSNWQNISAERGMELPILLGLMESDENFS